jgi:4'-phosphopantetheinyl transferase
MVTIAERAWLAQAEDLAILSDEVHVWRASLNQPTWWVQKLGRMLSPEELRQAERLRSDKERQGFMVARGLLRAILSRYLDVEPTQLRFAGDAYAQPTLISPSPRERLSLSLSHAHELALIALTPGRRIGVGLGYLHPVPEMERIAEGLLSPQEKKIWQALPPSEKLRAFFKCWTCKQAYLKARGAGAGLAPGRLAVALVPAEDAQLLSLDGDPSEAARWSLRELAPAPDYVAALAVEGKGWQLTCWHYS